LTYVEKNFFKYPENFRTQFIASEPNGVTSEYPRDCKIFFVTGFGTRASLASHAEQGWLQRMPRGLKVGLLMKYAGMRPP